MNFSRNASWDSDGAFRGKLNQTAPDFMKDALFQCGYHAVPIGESIECHTADAKARKKVMLTRRHPAVLPVDWLLTWFLFKIPNVVGTSSTPVHQ